MLIMHFFFFFTQKTAYEIVSGDWSSDVCSSDLRGDELGHHNVGAEAAAQQPERRLRHPRHGGEEQRERVSRGIREVHGTQRNDALPEEQPRCVVSTGADT